MTEAKQLALQRADVPLRTELARVIFHPRVEMGLE